MNVKIERVLLKQAKETLKKFVVMLEARVAIQSVGALLTENGDFAHDENMAKLLNYYFFFHLCLSLKTQLVFQL